MDWKNRSYFNSRSKFNSGTMKAYSKNQDYLTIAERAGWELTLISGNESNSIFKLGLFEK